MVSIGERSSKLKVFIYLFLFVRIKKNELVSMCTVHCAMFILCSMCVADSILLCLSQPIRCKCSNHLVSIFYLSIYLSNLQLLQSNVQTADCTMTDSTLSVHPIFPLFFHLLLFAIHMNSMLLLLTVVV